MIKYFMLLRHAIARKNIENRHGGSGTELIDEGIRQIETISQLIKNSKVEFETILYSNRIQCVQTATLLCESIKIPMKQIDNLIPIHLGILDGLSEMEAKKKFPEYSELMTKWRNGLIEINELRIPGITDYKLFFNSGVKYINDLTKKGSSIVIATRSNLVQLGNIMSGNSCDKGGNYREIIWSNSEMLTFKFNTNQFSIFNPLTNISLIGRS
jgi:hypothetical protein